MSRANLFLAIALALAVASVACRKRNSPADPARGADAASVVLPANLTPIIPTEPHLVQTLNQVNEAIQAHVKSGKPAPRSLEELNNLRIIEFIAPPPAGRAWHVDATGRFVLVAK
jgi:hypothetical protein